MGEDCPSRSKKIAQEHDVSVVRRLAGPDRDRHRQAASAIEIE